VHPKEDNQEGLHGLQAALTNAIFLVGLLLYELFPGMAGGAVVNTGKKTDGVEEAIVLALSQGVLFSQTHHGLRYHGSRAAGCTNDFVQVALHPVQAKMAARAATGESGSLATVGPEKPGLGAIVSQNSAMPSVAVAVVEGLTGFAGVLEMMGVAIVAAGSLPSFQHLTTQNPDERAVVVRVVVLF
jgi:hypothetical protein